MTLCLPFLMFQGQAQEAIDLYMETFPGAELLEIQHHPEGTEIFDPESDEDDGGYPEDQPGHGTQGPGKGSRLIATAQLIIGGQVLMIQDSLVRQEISFSPSMSIAVVVDTSSEFDGIVEKLAEGGEYLMEPGDYDFAKNFAWVQDRFGLCWQVNHPLGAPEEDVAQAKAPEWS